MKITTTPHTPHNHTPHNHTPHNHTITSLVMKLHDIGYKKLLFVPYNCYTVPYNITILSRKYNLSIKHQLNGHQAT